MLCGIGADRCRRPSTNRTLVRRPLIAVFALAVAAAAGGCGLTADQRRSVGTFGTASTKFGTAVSNGIATMREGAVTANLAALTLSPGRSSLPLHRKCGTRTFEGPFSAKDKDIGALMKGGAFIQKYGETLVTYATTSRKADLDKASAALSASIAQLQGLAPDPGSQFTAKQTTAVAKVIAWVGNAFVDIEKQSRIKAIVASTDEHVATAAVIIAKGLAPDGPLAKCLLATVAFSRDRARRRLATRSGDLQSRKLAADSYRSAIEAEATLTGLFRAAVASAKNMSIAHGRLARALQRNEYALADFKAFYESAIQIADAVKTLSTTVK